jgi:hypothetical protein
MILCSWEPTSPCVVRFKSVVVLVLLLAHGLAMAAEVRGLSVSDLIGLTRFGSRLAGGFGEDEVVVSPDGVHTAVVVQKGVLHDNTRQFSLLVFANDKPYQHTGPCVVAQSASVSNRPGISQVAWLSNETLAFLAEGPDAHPQVYTVDLGSQELMKRTHSELPITMFKAVLSHYTLVYATQPPQATTADFGALRAHGFVVPLSVPVSDVIAGKWEAITSSGSKESFLHFVQDGTETTVSVPDEVNYGRCNLDDPFASSNFTLAPSGLLALISCRPKSSPARWAAYREKEFRRDEDRGAQHPWWIVLDMHSGEAHPLTGGASLNSRANPLWTSDSNSVIIVNDLVPLDGVSKSERAARARQRYTAEVDVHTGASNIITRKGTMAFGNWDSTTATLTLQSEASNSTARPALVRYRKTQSGWTELKSETSAAPHAAFEVQQGLNEPWKLVRVTPDEKVAVYEPNTSLLATHRIAHETLFRWKSKSGADLLAGLYWPLDYQKGKRYPLLIQTHGFEEEKFAPDGYSTTGYAAQPLAAAGVVVIQAYKCLKYCDTPERNALSEGQKVQQDWESMIDRLNEFGLIDRSKVGLQGYSRSCYWQLYFLAHSSYPIAGMICADGVDGSYMQYLLYAPSNPGVAKLYALMNGGAAFGANLKTWLDRAPGFNLNKIHTPVRLIGLTGGSSLLSEWEPYAGLVLQGKPAELLFIPDAAHNIVRPWERVTSQQGTVDWFRFWLQDYERTEPISDAEETTQQLTDQYARWHKLRELQQADLAKVHATPATARP